MLSPNAEKPTKVMVSFLFLYAFCSFHSIFSLRGERLVKGSEDCQKSEEAAASRAKEKIN